MTTKKFKIDYYKNMPDADFEKFCVRLMTLHKTGVYIPPPPKPQICNNKKRAKTIPRKYNPEDKKLKTTFGKGRVGVSCESYGVRNCACCQPDNVERPRIIPNVLQNRPLPQENELLNYGKVACEIYGIKDCTCCQPGILPNLLQNYTLRKRAPKIVENPPVAPVLKRSERIEKLTAPVLIIDDSEDELNTTICLNSTNEFDIDILNTSFIDHQTYVKPSVKVENNKKKITDEIVIFDSDSDEDKKKYVVSKSKPDKLRAESKMLLQKLMNNVNEKENDSPPLLNKLKVKSPKFKINAPLQATSEKRLDCPVCLEPLVNKEVMSTICGHLFCANCIINCIRATKSCPNCRKKLTLKSIHPIFL